MVSVDEPEDEGGLDTADEAFLLQQEKLMQMIAMRTRIRMVIKYTQKEEEWFSKHPLL